MSTPPVTPPLRSPSAPPAGGRLHERLLARPAVVRILRPLRRVAGTLRGEPITLRAAALTYLTLLSFIPLLAVVFSVLQAVVGTKAMLDPMRDFILENLAVGARETFQQHVQTYVQRASAAAVGGFGFAFLLFSSVSLLANIEAAFNHIFKAPRPRPLALRIGVYWCLLTLGPLLLALSLSSTALLPRMVGPLRPLVGYVLPLVVTCGAFMLLYVILPAVTVPRRAAFLGALVAGSLWELAKVVYARVATMSVRKDAIYGSLSAIPTFMLWTYVSWIIVLFGARVAYASWERRADLSADEVATPRGRELSCARVMLVVARTFAQLQPPPVPRHVAIQAGCEEATAHALLWLLRDHGLVREDSKGGFLPARPLGTLTLADVRAAARGDGPVDDAPMAPDLALLAGRWTAADAAAGTSLATTYAELVALTSGGDVPTQGG
jgi:membrane protein